jgi:hypothetical protein
MKCTNRRLPSYLPISAVLAVLLSLVTACANAMKDSGSLSWPGFTFTGWDTQDNGGIDGGGGGTFYTPDQGFTINSDVTLYGTWVSGP